MLRVTKPGGVIILVTPNRLFPIDEHGKGKTGIRWHLPFRDQTLSYFELRKLFLPKCGRMGVLPYEGYYELEKLERLGGGPLVRLVKFVLPIFSNCLLHVLGPHLFLYFQKKSFGVRSDPTKAPQHVSAQDFRPFDEFVGSCARFRLHRPLLPLLRPQHYV